MRRALLIAALALAGCYAPRVHNGELQCSIDDHRCPAGFHCAADNTCWKNGQDPGLTPADMGDDQGPATNRAAGDPCSAASQCASGFCAPEGVCCDRACTGSCEACNLPGSPGVCTNVPAGAMPAANHDGCGPDAQSTCMRDGTCDGNGACHLWTDVICKPGSCDPGTGKAVAPSKCDGMGACITPNAVDCDPYVCLPDNTACYATCTAPAVGCKAPNACNAGSCGPKSNGAACSGDTDCKSGHCAPDGVCCDTACTGACEACNIAPDVGVCTAVTSGQPRAGHGGNCAGYGTTCGGQCAAGNRATCSFPGNQLPNVTCSAQACANATTQQNAAQCNGAGGCKTPTTTACGAYRCASNACLSSCSSDSDDSPCAPGYFCNQPQCLATRPLGRACPGGAGDCTSGFCVDAVCCNVACTGQCQRCDSPAGSCTMVTGSPVNGRAACPTGESTCDATCTGTSPDCVFPDGTACTDPRDNMPAVCSGSGCYHPGSCFAAGTLVDTADGPRPIEEIRRGDLVRSFDVLGGIEHLRPVVSLQARRASSLVRVAFGDGEVVDVTPEHYFWVRGAGWVRAAELEPDDALVTGDGGTVAVTGLASLALPEGEAEVYNLEVDGDGTYFVGGVPVLVESCDYTSFSSVTADELPQ